MDSPKKYLDKDGLSKVWNKIVEKFGKSEYSLIEYLESHATTRTDGPWIDTGVKLTSDCTIEAEFQFTSMDNHTNCCVYGSRETTQPTSNARMGFGWSESINAFRFDYAKKNTTVSTDDRFARIHLKQQVNKLYFDITLKAQATYASFTTPHPMVIFAQKTEDVEDVNKVGECTNLKLYYFKISDGSVTMDLRPCKKNSTGELGLLDTVSGKFLVNQGNGLEFTAGPEIVVDEPTTPDEILPIEKGGTGCTTVEDIRTMLFNFGSDEEVIKFVTGNNSILTGLEPVSVSNLRSVIRHAETSQNRGKSYQGHSNGYSWRNTVYTDRCSFIQDFSDGITYRDTDSRFIIPTPCNLRIRYTITYFKSTGSMGSNPNTTVRVRLLSDSDNSEIIRVFQKTYYDLSVVGENIDETVTISNLTSPIVWFELYVAASGYTYDRYNGGSVASSTLELTTV